MRSYLIIKLFHINNYVKSHTIVIHQFYYLYLYLYFNLIHIFHLNSSTLINSIKFDTYSMGLFTYLKVTSFKVLKSLVQSAQKSHHLNNLKPNTKVTSFKVLRSLVQSAQKSHHLNNLKKWHLSRY